MSEAHRLGEPDALFQLRGCRAGASRLQAPRSQRLCQWTGEVWMGWMDLASASRVRQRVGLRVRLGEGGGQLRLEDNKDEASKCREE